MWSFNFGGDQGGTKSHEAECWTIEIDDGVVSRFSSWPPVVKAEVLALSERLEDQMKSLTVQQVENCCRGIVPMSTFDWVVEPYSADEWRADKRGRFAAIQFLVNCGVRRVIVVDVVPDKAELLQVLPNTNMARVQAREFERQVKKPALS